MGFSIGRMLNKALDTFLPDAVGDVVGIIVDGATLNPAGAVVNGIDLMEDMAEWAGDDEFAGFLRDGLELFDAATGALDMVVDDDGPLGELAESLSGLDDEPAEDGQRDGRRAERLRQTPAQGLEDGELGTFVGSFGADRVHADAVLVQNLAY